MPGTPAIRALLDQYDVKATFFVVGFQIAQRPTELAAHVASGHTIGNHTYNHPDLRTLSDAEIVEELTSNAELIASISGQPAPTCMRPPGGYTNQWDGPPVSPMNPDVLEIIASTGLAMEKWTHDTRDWDAANVGVIDILNVLNSLPTAAGSKSTVLMHDGMANTLTAMQQWLPANLDRYDFRVLPSC